MSLILDALARAERDKRRAAAPLPDLLENSPGEVPAASHRYRLAIAALVAVTAVLSVLYIRSLGADARSGPAAAGDVPAGPRVAAPGSRADGPESPPVTGADTQRGQPPGAEAKPAARIAPAAQPLPPARTVDSTGAETNPVAALYDRGPGPRDQSSQNQPPRVQAPDAVSVPASRGPEAQSTAPGTSSPALPETRPGAAGDAGTAVAAGKTDADSLRPERIEETIDLEAVLRDVRAEGAADGLAPHPAPLLSELSQQFRDDVPTLMYLRHDYNPAGVSTVLLNGETLRVGGRSRGVELREILADSAVFLFQGQQFRLRALNSWVNL